jgi:CubicO group peptidase (beta-lactamase class C family)
LHREEKFNGAILIAKNGKPLLCKGYGYVNHFQNEELTKNSSFNLASVSKQFTAVGIMLLKEQGKLSYSDLISKYIADFPYEGVTIRNLLNHSSGVPEYFELAEARKEQISVLTSEMVANLLLEEKPEADFAPGESFRYSNTNYVLLARIIEIVSGASFEKFMQLEVFDPLKMEDTRVWTLESEDKIFPNKTGGFRLDNDQAIEVKPNFIDGVAGDGSVFSSVNDFLKWDSFWYGNELISPSNLQEAFKIPKLMDGTISNYGFGWQITEEGMQHTGGWLAARAIIIRNLDKKTCIVVLDNSSNPYFEKVVKELKTIDNII